MSDAVLVTANEAVLEICLNRPDKKNAITNAMYGTVADALADAEANPDIRVALISGTGDAFTAGNDLADFAAVTNGTLARSDLNVTRMLANLTSMAKPVIAAVNGLAVGVGTTMLLHCDLVYVSQSAKLTVPFVNLALVPEAASSRLLPELVGNVRAFAMFALGEPMSADAAVAVGLANAVCVPDELMPTARKAARALAARAPMALARTKQLMRDPLRTQAIMKLESAHFADQLQSPEAGEAFAAFFEQRAPDFSRVA